MASASRIQSLWLHSRWFSTKALRPARDFVLLFILELVEAVNPYCRGLNLNVGCKDVPERLLCSLLLKSVCRAAEPTVIKDYWIGCL